MRNLAIGAAAAAAGLFFLLATRRRRILNKLLNNPPITLQLTLIGFGSVNRALARRIASQTEVLRRTHNLIIVYRAVVARHGAWEGEMDALTVAKCALATTYRTRSASPLRVCL